MPRIDFHTHFFSRAYFEALARESAREGSMGGILDGLSQRSGIEIPPPSTADHLRRWIETLDAGGVDRAVSFASHPAEALVLAEAGRLAAGRITPMLLVDPRAEGAAERARTMMREHGFGGVLLFPAMHHFHVGGPEARALLTEVAQTRGIVYVHCGLLVVKLRDLLGLPRRLDPTFANPLEVVPAADAFPEASFVIPHFGAGFFRETLMAGAQCANVHVDSSSSHSWMRTSPERLELREVFARALEAFGPERVLFGTDSGAFPAGWRRDRFEEQQEALAAAGATAEECESVFGGNARTLLARRQLGTG